MATLVRSMGSRTEDDDRIRNDVRRQITLQSDIQSEEIGIQVKNRMVFLDGRVETRLERLEAENAAKAAYGVSSVTNNIRVVPKRERSDSDIQGDVNAGLRAVLCVLEKSPAVMVQDGVVVLEGTVRFSFQRVSAERIADAVIGVRSVHNRIQVGQSARVLRVPESYRPRTNTTPTLLLERGDARLLIDDRPVLAAAS
jgi:osmotically-inducible protein OsmY